MRLYLPITLLFLIPASLFAQDTTALKAQANIVAKAVVKGDYSTVIDKMYPKAVLMGGGKAKLLQMMNAGTTQMKAQGVSFVNAAIGSPGKFYKAGTEIHCLVPEVINMKVPNGILAMHANLLAISKDGGRRWTFLDLNKNTIDLIPKIFPKFNKALIIPQPTLPALN